uniref:RNA-dependent RNA polymerase n=1 Tax=Mongoose picobirnavirus TaxID=2684263 RepID=A0A6B9UPX7_9VIRU|nr:RNA-dependent RNA polymerase [Mongoose picobirnavirus]
MPKNIENGTIGKYFDLPNPGLVSYFDIVQKGQPEVYSTPFARHNGGTQKVLKDWLPQLDKISEQWPTLLEFEKDLATKVGPMSVMKPLSERIMDIDSYYDGIHQPVARINDTALQAVVSEFSPIRGLHLRSQQRTVDLMKKSTNSGSPYFTKRRRVVEKTVPCRSNGQLQFLDGGEKTYDVAAILGWRGQEGGPATGDVKQRVVWMFPFAINILELQVYQPLIESAQRFNLVPSWVSMESVDQRITRMFDTKADGDLVVCTDFEKFDQHFNSALQLAAEQILRRILAPDADSLNWLRQIFPIKFNIPLAVDMNTVFTGAHGMGSGSGGTNADETLAHRALQYEAAIKNNSRLNPNSQCLGDDGVLTYPGITAEDVMQSYKRHGLKMNASKQYESTQDCTYLRRWHHKDYRMDGMCVGVYSTCRALGRLCEQERYYDPEIWSKEMVALRQLSIMENVKYHPLRAEFADFCMKRDMYRLGLDIPGFLDNIDRIAKESIEVMPDFLGYTKTMMKNQDVGLSSWWIVNYLKSK